MTGASISRRAVGHRDVSGAASSTVVPMADEFEFLDEMAAIALGRDRGG